MKEQPVILSRHLLDLMQNLKYYLDTVNEYRYKYGITQIEAWERVEAEMENAGIAPRYTSYESFRSGQHNYHNRNNTA